jgi:hypothetical protein
MVKRATDLTDTFTMTAWVHPTLAREVAPAEDRYAGTHGQRYAIYPTHGGEAGKEAGCGISVGTNGIGLFEHTHDNCPCVLADDTPIKDWTHVGVVYTKGQPTLYVNGSKVKTGNRSPWTVFPGTYFGDPSTNYGPFLGLVDEPMVFDRALTAEEVKALLRATRTDQPVDKASAAPSEAALSEWCSYLAGERAPRSLFAIHRLALSGDAAVTRLRPLVKPPPETGKPTIEELVLQLDDDAFKTRERAMRSLIEKGSGVAPKLRAHLQGAPSAEVRARINKILAQFSDAGTTAEELRALRAVTALSRIATPASRELLAEVAEGPEGMPVTLAAKAALSKPGPSEK